MRITSKVFYDLAIWQIGFGLLVGLGFRFFVIALGVPREEAFTPGFFSACLAAGALAGVVNHLIARRVVGRRLTILAERMSHVEASLETIAEGRDLSACTPERCAIAVDSDDEIGASALAFNHLVQAFFNSIKTQLAVRSFSEMLTSHLEVASLAEEALRQFFAHTGAGGGLVLYESAGELRQAAARGLRDPETVASSSHVLAAVRSGEQQVIRIPADVQVEGVVADFRAAEVRVCPVTYKSVPLGVVVLASPSPFTPDQTDLIGLFVQGLGLALNNAVAHDRLQTLAALDPLTGIYKRRFGMARLHEEFGRAVRLSSPLGVLMLDIDHFKAVNDTYGHLIGDRVLKSVCSVVRSSLREGDVLLRYGGEELLAVMPAASAADIRQMGERLRKMVEDSSVVDGEKTVHVTLSAGGAAYPDQGAENDLDLIRLADQALYRAKSSGRNRVELAR